MRKSEDFDCLSRLQLSVRARKILDKAGVTTIEQLLKTDMREIVKLPNCGVLVVCEIAEQVKKLASGDALKREKEWADWFDTHKLEVKALRKMRQIGSVLGVEMDAILKKDAELRSAGR